MALKQICWAPSPSTIVKNVAKFSFLLLSKVWIQQKIQEFSENGTEGYDKLIIFFEFHVIFKCFSNIETTTTMS